MSEDVIIAQKEPYAVEVEAGKTYYWCAFGRSKEQPFCDGSHQDTAFQPMEFKVARHEKVWLCGCKRSGKKPFCDGAHKELI